MQAIWFSLLSTFFGAVLVYAQPIVVENVVISDACVNTVRTVMTSPEAECLDLGALLTLFLIGNEASVITPINNWLQGLCSVGKCSEEDLTGIINTVMTGCRDEIIEYTGSTPEAVQGDVNAIALQVYPVARDAVCLVNDTSDQLCVTETLNNLESMIGTLNFNRVNTTLIAQDVQTVLSAGVSELACTSCMKQVYNLANQGIPDIISPANGVLVETCGAEFVDGSIPANITTSAITDDFVPVVLINKKNGASKLGYTPWLLIAWSAIAFWM